MCFLMYHQHNGHIGLNHFIFKFELKLTGVMNVVNNYKTQD